MMNPLASPDQLEIEALALEVFQMSAVVTARQQALMRWKTIVGRDAPQEAWGRRFDELIEEFCFAYVLKAVNSDANYPKVLNSNYGPPHEWFGMKVPGSRAGGGDNPDNNYTYIPIDGYTRYEITGARIEPGPADVPITVSGNIAQTAPLGGLDWQDIKVDTNGNFVITVGPEPANGRPNHLQTRLDARCVFTRDCRSDWRQIPHSYSVKRLDPPAAPRLTIDQIASRAAHYMVDDVPTMYWWMRIMDGLEPNVIPPLADIGALGGLATQTLSLLRLNLKNDEAFVFTTGSGGARYRSVVLQDWWFRTFDYWNNTSTLNCTQSLANERGETTYVVAHRDPGIHNWINTCGCHEPKICVRWRGIPRQGDPAGRPWIRGKLIKLDQLDSEMPRDVVRSTPETRRLQLKERIENFRLRYVEH